MTGFSRRTLGKVGLAATIAAALPLRLLAQAIPQKASARVIIDNDFAGDPDGLVALAHHLLSPKTRTVLITVSGLNPRMMDPGQTPEGAIRDGAELAAETMARLGIAERPIVALGREPAAHGPSDAARAIVAEALRQDSLPLYFCCGGPLTNLAAALAMEPAIAKRMTLIWIGGGAYPDGAWEYNLAVDPGAARAVIEQSAIPIWQVPQPAYRQMQLSVAEMRSDLYPLSDFGRWLYGRFTHPPAFIDVGGAWPIGDSPLVLLTAISAESSRYAEITARRIQPDMRYGEPIAGRTIRVYETLDMRLTWADFLAKLRLHAAGSPL